MLRVIPKYPEIFKIRLVRQIEQGDIRVEEARRRYSIGGKMTISKWRKKYANCFKNDNWILEKMKKEENDNQLERKLRDTEAELRLYKKLIEVSDYFRDPQVKKKIVERLSAYLGKAPENLMAEDIPLLKSVLYSESQDKDIINTKKGQRTERNKRKK